MKKLFLIPILSLLFSAQAFGAGSAPRATAAEERISAAEVALTPNYVINGDITFNQRGNVTGIADSGYVADRFQYRKSGAMVHNSAQSTDVPSIAQSGHASQYSASLVLTTPDTSIGSGEYAFVWHKVEGTNYAQFAGKSFTLSFWVKATLTGVYSISFRNGTADTSYVSTFTISTTETWEKKTITVPAPSIGTWAYDTSAGLIITWGLAYGSTYQTSTLNAWQSGNFTSPTTQVNGVNTGATNFKLAQIMLNEGTRAAPFKLAGGDVQGELVKAQRYYYRLGSEYVGSGVTRSATLASILIKFPVQMRIAPTAIETNTSTAFTYASIENGGDWGSMAVTFSSASEKMANTLWSNGGASMTTGQGAEGKLLGIGYLGFSAEL